jgi:dihydrofolate reductase
MRKIIFAINMTLDGFFDHTAVIADDELHEKAAQLFRSADVVMFGRETYQLMAEYWPTAGSDPSLSPGVREFAEAINRIDKIVFSKTLQSAGWNTRIQRTLDPGEIKAMKGAPGRDILLGGGANLAQAFMNLDLIDEYRLIIHPILLGSGKRLFNNIATRKDLRLIGQDVRGSGAVELIYQPVSLAGKIKAD